MLMMQMLLIIQYRKGRTCSLVELTGIAKISNKVNIRELVSEVVTCANIRFKMCVSRGAVRRAGEFVKCKTA